MILLSYAAAGRSTFSVPRTLVEMVRAGSLTTSSTPTAAARWMTMSDSFTSFSAVERSSATSVSTTFSAGTFLTAFRLAGLPVEKLSATVTS